MSEAARSFQQARTRAASAWNGLPPGVRGALWMLISTFLFVVMTALVKFLGNRLHSFEVAFFRALTSVVVLVPMALRAGAAGFKTQRPGLHLLRGLFGSTAMLCGFYAFTHLPLADATAISFSRALFLVPLAMLVLGEVVGPRRMIATLIGFAGVLIILRPSGSTDPAAFVALANALFVALAVTCVKMLSRQDSPVTLLLYSGLIGTVVTAVPAAAVWITPTFEEFLLLMVMGMVGLAAHACFVRAYSLADATAMAPLDYLRLIWAALVGYLVFSNLPDLLVVVGALIIAGASLYITVREAQLQKGKEKEKASPET